MKEKGDEQIPVCLPDNNMYMHCCICNCVVVKTWETRSKLLAGDGKTVVWGLEHGGDNPRRDIAEVLTSLNIDLIVCSPISKDEVVL